MEFVLKGVRHSLDPDMVRTALRGGAPDEIREHWVDVDGVRWPPKQAFSRATGLERTEFTSHEALRQLHRLGFATSSWGGSRGGAGDPGAARPPAPAPHRPVEKTTADIILVGCSSSKAPQPRPAAELFTGAAFGKARDLAR